jgi:outer membrane protein
VWGTGVFAVQQKLRELMLGTTAAAFAVLTTPPLIAASATASFYQNTQRVQLTSEQMFKLADAALARGDFVMAAALLEALEQNRDVEVRAEARFRRASQLLQEKRHREAAVLLRRILDEKPNVAGVRLQLARVLQLLGEPDAALRELRLVQTAGLPPGVARLVDRYSEALRASRPAGLNFEIAIAPDSNINQATHSDTLGTVIGDFDIDSDSKAHSGIGVAARGHAYRRFPINGSDHALLARLSGSADIYRQGSFNNLAADLAVGPELHFGANRLNLEVGGTHRWLGQKLYLRSARLGATWVQPLDGHTQLRLNGTAVIVDNLLNNLQDGKTFSAQLGIERALSSTRGVALNLSIHRQSLEDTGYSTTGSRIGILGWQDWERMTFSFDAQLGRLKADERLNLFPEKRSDRYTSITVGGSFRQFTFQGFAPVARFTIERNRSSIEFYDYRRTRSEVGLVRAF